MTPQNSFSDDRRTDLKILATIGVLFVLTNLRWVYLFRSGQPLDIDEAGYLGISLRYFDALVQGGVGAWISAIEAPNIHAPFAMVLSSLAYAIAGPEPLVGFLVIIGFGLLTVVSTYFLADLIGGRNVAMLSSILVACSPIIVNYTRSYHFAIPATAVATLGLLTLAKTNQFSRLNWALLFGVCVGLLPLTRTMAIAFVPALVIAAILQVVVAPDQRRGRLLILGLSLALATLVAALWLMPNGQAVFNYLFNFGYGARAAAHGPSQEHIVGPQNFTFFLQTLGAYVYLPNFVLILAGFAFLSLRTISALWGVGLKPALKRIVSSSAFPPALLVLEGTLALASSQNKGSAFIAPLIPSMLILAVLGILGWRSTRAWRLASSTLVLIVAVVSLLPLLDLRLSVARPRLTELPLIGGIYVADGRGTIQRYEAAGGYSTDNPVVPIDASTGREWVAAIAKTAEKLAAVGDGKMPIAVGIRHYLYNTNALQLARSLAGKPQLPMWQIDTEITDGSVASYSAWLTSSAIPCILLTSSSGKGEMLPAVDSGRMEIAAGNSGFTTIDKWSLPDGRVVKLWRSSYPACGVKNAQLGDVFGRVESLAADELFVHPGAKTPSSFELALDSSWKSLSLSIPEAVLKSCPDANGVNVEIDLGGQRAWSATVRPGSPQMVPLPGDGPRDFKLTADNNAQPNCDHLHVKFSR